MLAPNAALCRQVVAAADSLVGADGRPLVTAAHLSSATPPPHHAVDLAVSTPGQFVWAEAVGYLTNLEAALHTFVSRMPSVQLPGSRIQQQPDKHVASQHQHLMRLVTP